jgi:hypothetical protein
MVEAAVRGIVDFSQARIYDPAWRRRLTYLISGLQALNYREELRLSHDYYLALLGVPALKPESFEDLKKGLQAVQEKLETAFRPWHSGESEAAKKRAEQAELRAAWERQWGKLDDPATQQRIARMAHAFQQQRQQNQSEPDPDAMLTNARARGAARAKTGRPSRRKHNDAVGSSRRATRRWFQ